MLEGAAGGSALSKPKRRTHATAARHFCECNCWHLSPPRDLLVVERCQGGMIVGRGSNFLSAGRLSFFLTYSNAAIGQYLVLRENIAVGAEYRLPPPLFVPKIKGRGGGRNCHSQKKKKKGLANVAFVCVQENNKRCLALFYRSAFVQRWWWW